MSRFSQGASAPVASPDLSSRFLDLTAFGVARCDSLNELFTAIERLCGHDDPTLVALAGIGSELAKEALRHFDRAREEGERRMNSDG